MTVEMWSEKKIAIILNDENAKSFVNT